MRRSRTHTGGAGNVPTCEHCGVQAVIREDAILRAIAKGLDLAGLMVVAKDGNTVTTPACILNDLNRVLREKGFRVV